MRIMKLTSLNNLSLQSNVLQHKEIEVYDDVGLEHFI